MTLRIRFLVMLACLLFLGACSARRQAQHLPAEAVLLDSDRGAAAVSRVTGQSGAVESFRALSRTTVRYKEERSQLRHIFAIERPDRLRIEALPLNGFYTLSLFTASGGEAVLLDPSEKTAERGGLEPALIRKMLKVPLSGQDLVYLIAGRVPPEALSTRAYSVYLTEADGKLHFLSSDGRYYFSCFRDSGLPEYFEARDAFSGKLSFAVTYSNRIIVNEVEVPSAVAVNVASEDFDLNLSFSNIAVNQKLPDRLFKVDVPDDYRVFSLDNSGTE